MKGKIKSDTGGREREREREREKKRRHRVARISVESCDDPS
jgi:hypothetical protein